MFSHIRGFEHYIYINFDNLPNWIKEFVKSGGLSVARRENHFHRGFLTIHSNYPPQIFIVSRYEDNWFVAKDI